MKRARGFTFAETLAAIAFTAIVIPVAMQAITLANRSGVLAERRRLAAELAERRLTEIVVANNWQGEDKSGDFGDDWPGYRWQFSDAAWTEDTMRALTVQVFFIVQDHEYSVSLSTLVPETESTPTSQDTQDQQGSQAPS